MVSIAVQLLLLHQGLFQLLLPVNNEGYNFCRRYREVVEYQIVFKLLVSQTLNLLLGAQVLKRLVGTDEHLYSNYTSAMQWVEDTDVLEMIVDKFGSSVSSIQLHGITLLSIWLVLWLSFFTSDFILLISRRFLLYFCRILPRYMPIQLKFFVLQQDTHPLVQLQNFPAPG